MALIYVVFFLSHFASADIDWNAVAETKTFKASMATGYNYFEKFKKYGKSAENLESRQCWSTLLEELPELCNRSKVLVSFPSFLFITKHNFYLESSCSPTDLLLRSKYGQGSNELCHCLTFSLLR